MKLIRRTAVAAALAAALSLANAGVSAQSRPYRTQVIARGLSRPTGIAVNARGDLYFTQLPTPGVAGGANTVSVRDFRTGAITDLTVGEPEPTNIALDGHGDPYWTCKSADVILKLPRGAAEAMLVLGGLARPSGIAVDRNGRDRGTVYFTQVPTPGVAGGSNGVFAFDGEATTTLHLGEPEPTDIAVDHHGALYWTCKSAGVILQQSEGVTSVLLSGLNKPQGIALDRSGGLYFTEVPTPGLPGAMGGQNRVWKYDLKRGVRILVDAGDPEPADITVRPNGTLYWTCASAGVIVAAIRW